MERPVFDEFVERLKLGAENLAPGRPELATTTLGPMISAQQREKVLCYYAKAREQGAQIVTGGAAPQVPDELGGGFWVEPTIWTGLPETSPINREEIFGPCCHIQAF